MQSFLAPWVRVIPNADGPLPLAMIVSNQNRAAHTYSACTSNATALYPTCWGPKEYCSYIFWYNRDSTLVGIFWPFLFCVASLARPFFHFIFQASMHTHNNPNIIQYLSTLFAHEITISTLLSYQFFLQLCRFEAHLYPVEVWGKIRRRHVWVCCYTTCCVLSHKLIIYPVTSSLRICVLPLCDDA